MHSPADSILCIPLLPPVVFVSRGIHTPSYNDPVAIPGFGPQYRTVVVGGSLLLRETDGTIRTVIGPTTLFDVADPCVSWDARRILFSGVLHPDSSWRIFEIGVDGTEFRRITTSDRRIDLSQFGAAAHLFERYDDFDPCYLPDGRIVFASTRYPSIASVEGVRTSNLFVVNPDGSALHRITTERNGGEEPTIDPLTGRIVYSRWWINPDRPSNKSRHGITRDQRLALTDDVANVWHATTIRSDGDGLKLYAGFPRTREGVQLYKPAVMDDGRLLGTFTPYTSMSPHLGGAGIRWFKKGADVPHHVVGTSSSRGEEESQYPYAADPVQLEKDMILLSYSEGGDFGIRAASIEGKRMSVIVDLPGTNELEPQLVLQRPVPPILVEEFPYPTLDLPPTEDPRTYFKNDTFRFDCMNIFTNGAVDEPMPDAPRLAIGARIRFFMNVQRQNPSIPDPSIFLKDAEVALGGGIHEHDLPADVPLFEQVVDSRGNVLETGGGRFAHVAGMNFDRMGSGTKCVGCHAGHSMLEVPNNGSIAEWFNAATSATVTASSSGRLIDGRPSLPQRVVDRQSKTGGDSVLWISTEREGAELYLTWEVPIEIREIVLHAIARKPDQGTTICVHDCEILLYYKSSLVRRVRSTGEIHEDGTRVEITSTDTDSVRVVIRRSDGEVFYQPVCGLAEIEVTARISRLNYHPKREG